MNNKDDNEKSNSDEEELWKEPQKKKKRTQITLFACSKGIKKVSYGRNKKLPVLSDFTPQEEKGIRGSHFGNTLKFICEGCDANFKKAQGLGGHKKT